MKINWNRNIKKRQEYKNHKYMVCSCFLKAESNIDRRITDRKALRRFLAGDDSVVFAMSNMGNPWHWD